MNRSLGPHKWKQAKRLLAVAGAALAFAVLASSAAGDPSPVLTNSNVVQLVCDDGNTYSAIHDNQAGQSEIFFSTTDSRIFVAVSLGFPGEPPFYFTEGFNHNNSDLLTCTVQKRAALVVVVGFFTQARP
jgi:hypothetical protein